MHQTSSKTPTSFERELIKKQALLRGHIIGGYSQTEFLLLHIALQSRILKEYWHLELKYHRKLDNRISQLKKLLSSEGPLKKYENRTSDLLVKFEPLKDNRDFLAHAFCRIHYSKDKTMVIYKMLKMDDGQTRQIEHAYTMEELESLKQEITDLTQEFLLLFKEIYLTEGLEEFGSFI